jgi:hypothetical protein
MNQARLEVPEPVMTGPRLMPAAPPPVMEPLQDMLEVKKPVPVFSRRAPGMKKPNVAGCKARLNAHFPAPVVSHATLIAMERVVTVSKPTPT